jgi:hypothetical protein
VQSAKSSLARLLRPHRLVILSVLLVLGGYELVLRAGVLGSRESSGWLISPDAPQAVSVPVNELGYRGRPFLASATDSRCNLVLLGDSQVECLDCKPPDLPEVLLEDALARRGVGVHVLTVGASGYGQDQQLLGLGRYFELRRPTAAVVLWQTIQNDIWNNVFPTHWPGYADGTPKPTYWLAGDTLLGPTEDIGDPPFHSLLLDRVRRSLGVGRDELWEYLLLPPSRPGLLEVPPAAPVHVLARTEDLQKEKSHVAILRADDSPRLDYGIRLTRRLLGRIRDLAESHAARFAIFQEDRFAIEARELPEGDFFLTSQGYYFPANLRYGRERRDRTDQGFLFFEIPVHVPDPLISRSNRHLKDAANRDVLDQVADRLIERRIVTTDRSCKRRPAPGLVSSRATRPTSGAPARRG